MQRATETQNNPRGDADISRIGALLADPARCRVLMALNDGRALPASVLADEAGISRSTAGGHLARLTEAGLQRMEAQGRHRYYRLSGPEVGELLERISRPAPARPVRSLRPVLVNARTDTYWRPYEGPDRFAAAVRRLGRHRAAGADCLFAPASRSLD